MFAAFIVDVIFLANARKRLGLSSGCHPLNKLGIAEDNGALLFFAHRAMPY